MIFQPGSGGGSGLSVVDEGGGFGEFVFPKEAKVVLVNVWVNGSRTAGGVVFPTGTEMIIGTRSADYGTVLFATDKKTLTITNMSNRDDASYIALG